MIHWWKHKSGSQIVRVLLSPSWSTKERHILNIVAFDLFLALCLPQDVCFLAITKRRHLKTCDNSDLSFCGIPNGGKGSLFPWPKSSFAGAKMKAVETELAIFSKQSNVLT